MVGGRSILVFSATWYVTTWECTAVMVLYKQHACMLSISSISCSLLHIGSRSMMIFLPPLRKKKKKFPDAPTLWLYLRYAQELEELTYDCSSTNPRRRHWHPRSIVQLSRTWDCGYWTMSWFCKNNRYCEKKSPPWLPSKACRIIKETLHMEDGNVQEDRAWYYEAMSCLKPENVIVIDEDAENDVDNESRGPGLKRGRSWICF